MKNQTVSQILGKQETKGIDFTDDEIALIIESLENNARTTKCTVEKMNLLNVVAKIKTETDKKAGLK